MEGSFLDTVPVTQSHFFWTFENICALRSVGVGSSNDRTFTIHPHIVGFGCKRSRMVIRVNFKHLNYVKEIIFFPFTCQFPFYEHEFGMT